MEKIIVDGKIALVIAPDVILTDPKEIDAYLATVAPDNDAPLAESAEPEASEAVEVKPKPKSKK